jgi:hypothetical protein
MALFIITCNDERCRYNCFKVCLHPLPCIDNRLNQNIARCRSKSYKDICNECGLQNSENCNTCNKLHPWGK